MHTFYLNNFLVCPRCGASFINLEDHLYCEVCKFRIYPHPSPATAVFIFNDKKQLLLAKRKKDPMKGFWDSVGGFINTEESVEQGAIRECFEETGLEVKIDQIIGSHPDIYQGTPTLTIGVIASIVSGNPVANDDIASLEWLKLDNLPSDNVFAFESVVLLLKKAIKIYKNNY